MGGGKRGVVARVSCRFVDLARLGNWPGGYTAALASGDSAAASHEPAPRHCAADRRCPQVRRVLQLRRGGGATGVSPACRPCRRTRRGYPHSFEGGCPALLLELAPHGDLRTWLQRLGLALCNNATQMMVARQVLALASSLPLLPLPACPSIARAAHLTAWCHCRFAVPWHI